MIADFLAAKKAFDGKRMCRLYSDEYRKLGELDPDNEDKLSCEQLAESYARSYPGERNSVLRIEEREDVAIATLSCEDSTAPDCSLRLVKQDGEWKIDGSLSPND